VTGWKNPAGHEKRAWKKRAEGGCTCSVKLSVEPVTALFETVLEDFGVDRRCCYFG
jgi:hypothetical protein